MTPTELFTLLPDGRIWLRTRIRVSTISDAERDATGQEFPAASEWREWTIDLSVDVPARWGSCADMPGSTCVTMKSGMTTYIDAPVAAFESGYQKALSQRSGLHSYRN